MVSVFNYSDYRQFLRDWYDEAQKSEENFSARNLARRAGLASPSFFKMVIDGKRNLSEERIEKFASALKLADDERAFFTDLVLFCQAGSSAERNHHYQRMCRCKRFLDAHTLERERFEYFSRWYYAAIREMVGLPEFRDDPAWIAARLNPRITDAEAAEAIEVLERLGMVARDGDGNLHLAQESVGTEDTVSSMHLLNFHRSMIRRACDSLGSLDSRDRNVSSLTAAVSRKRFGEITRRINDFRKELRAMLEDCSDVPEEVFQVNFQVFSLTGGTDEA
jgi:uncharacterized protein (TIGR02147 family)